MPNGFALGRVLVKKWIAPIHAFKLWMGSAHFLTKTLKRARTEMSLHVLACNLKRVIKILGVGQLMQAMKA
jgi:hypothetical protein